jgi:hypothetical protein
MQHPDEGTIHSWLDGALSAEEAASLESHVATCQSCAAAVAEARGFIAASSRILTALDDVPRGVVPAVPQRKRDLRVVWRAAAAMLVVAGGSLVVMREGGPDTAVVKAKDSVAFKAAPVPQPASPVATEGSGTSTSQSQKAAISEPTAVLSRARAGNGSVVDERDLSVRAERRQTVPEAGGVASGVASGVMTGGASSRIAADAAVPTSAPAQIADRAASEKGEAALKVLKVERSPGSRRTIYEISPSQTVTLTEPETVLGAVASAPAAAQPTIRLRGNNAIQPSRTEAARTAPPPPPMMDSRTTTDSVLASRQATVGKAAAAQTQSAAAFAAASNTISWTEARTGKTLTLSGNLTVERLQEIRQRIERERAAAGAKP